ncbi:MAG: hypothetical protein ACRC7N_20665 [Clostridium sp.]
MGVKLKGLDRLMKKLNNMSDIKTKDIVKDVAKDAEKSIKARAERFSDTSYLHVGTVEVRDYNLSCFVDVGFSSDNVPFELWKSLWFQHWGFFNHGLNFTGQMYIQNNQLWFNEAVSEFENQALLKLKEKTRKKVRKALE